MLRLKNNKRNYYFVLNALVEEKIDGVLCNDCSFFTHSDIDVCVSTQDNEIYLYTWIWNEEAIVDGFKSEIG
jgi:hypothetical protein